MQRHHYGSVDNYQLTNFRLTFVFYKIALRWWWRAEASLIRSLYFTRYKRLAYITSHCTSCRPEAGTRWPIWVVRRWAWRRRTVRCQWHRGNTSFRRPLCRPRSRIAHTRDWHQTVTSCPSSSSSRPDHRAPSHQHGGPSAGACDTDELLLLLLRKWQYTEYERNRGIRVVILLPVLLCRANESYWRLNNTGYWGETYRGLNEYYYWIIRRQTLIV